jgi:hypothetical protein
MGDTPFEAAGPFLVRPNSSGVASLDGLVVAGQEYLGTRRADGTITLKIAAKTPFIGESSSAPTSGSTSSTA